MTTDSKPTTVPEEGHPNEVKASASSQRESWDVPSPASFIGHNMYLRPNGLGFFCGGKDHDHPARFLQACSSDPFRFRYGLLRLHAASFGLVKNFQTESSAYVHTVEVPLSHRASGERIRAHSPFLLMLTAGKGSPCAWFVTMRRSVRLGDPHPISTGGLLLRLPPHGWSPCGGSYFCGARPASRINQPRPSKDNHP
jgi:hypothetical protein